MNKCPKCNCEAQSDWDVLVQADACVIGSCPWKTSSQSDSPTKEELAEEAKIRKGMPVWSGFCNYFPDAMMYVSLISKAGNDQHNPGSPLHWDRSKSGDERDALLRHALKMGTVDSEGILESGRTAWRSMANLQKELELLGELANDK